MPALQFTRDLADAIRAGRKSQTLRAKAPRGCSTGARLTLLNGYRVDALFGYATIASVDQVSRAAITHDDAIRDGFASLAELVARLDAMRVPADAELWRVRWVDFTPARAVARPLVARALARRTGKRQQAGRRRRASRVPESAAR